MVLARKLSRCLPLSSSPLEKTSRELQHRDQMINVPMEPKQQLNTCPMNINGWTQGERKSTDVPLKNGHPPTIPWTWTLTMAHVKKGNRCSPKETNLHQIPGKDEPQRMFLKRNHIRPQAHAGDVQSVKEQQQSRNVCGDTLLWWWWFVCRGRLINVTSSVYLFLWEMGQRHYVLNTSRTGLIWNTVFSAQNVYWEKLKTL